jgi:hypothetical protein
MRSPAALIESVGIAHAGDVLGLVGIALVIVDARLRIVDLNEAAATMLGGRDDARGTPLCPDGECDDLRRLVETALEGQSSCATSPPLDGASSAIGRSSRPRSTGSSSSTSRASSIP